MTYWIRIKARSGGIYARAFPSLEARAWWRLEASPFIADVLDQWEDA